MKYITLLSILFFFSIGCGDSKEKEVQSAKSVTESALSGADDVVKAAEEVRAEIENKLSGINYTEDDMDNASDVKRSIMESSMERINIMKMEAAGWYDRSVQLKAELAAAQQQLSAVETKMKEGVSYEEATKDINVNIMNTSELLKTIENSIAEIKAYREEKNPQIELIVSHYENFKKG